jgi:hypothetical protein
VIDLKSQRWALAPDWSPAGIYDVLATQAWHRGDREAHKLYRQQEAIAKAATFVFRRTGHRRSYQP